MIGQETAKKTLFIYKNFPLILLVGAKGSGKKTLISSLFHEYIQVPDVKIDTIRSHVIDKAYTYQNTLFVIPDADDMSDAAKNALLKVVEESPNGNRFIITLEDANNTLPTIRSRGVIIKMDRYTPDEIRDYAKSYDNSISSAVDICDTPGEVQTLLSQDADEFYKYVALVFDNITQVSGANAFKIASKISLKDSDDGYDLRLFWKAYIKRCAYQIKTNYSGAIKYAIDVITTSRCLNELRTRGINKQMLFDKWILEIRKNWL